ncbi:MAG: antibiotic biosynthesis monooxygenase [Deltaproteobacteria bacterium]|jgi:quinol monooxygenase YgiN|nr:antibiotic biosynthesis monooxygenase [Deltaproteobacteria bacterium]
MSEVHILAGIELSAADRAAFMAFAPELVAGSRSEAGCRRYDLMQEQGSDLAFMIVETWASAEAIEEHNGTPHFKKLVAFLKDHPATLTIKKYNQLI